MEFLQGSKNLLISSMKSPELTYLTMMAKLTSLIQLLEYYTVAPYLFIIVRDSVLRKAISSNEEELDLHVQRRESRRIKPVIITYMNFPDDIALLLNSQKTEMNTWSQDNADSQVNFFFLITHLLSVILINPLIWMY